MNKNAETLPATNIHTDVLEPMTPDKMIPMAVEQGKDLDYIEKLMVLERRWKDDKAREAYFVALAEFKKQPLAVTKDKVNNQYNSRYTSIGNLVNTVATAMAPFGLNARWDIDQSDGIKVTCVLSHTLGHSESVSMSGPPDTSGKKNDLQQIKSTVTYLQSATFQSVTGVVSQDTIDDDGNGAGAEPITESQLSTLVDLIAASETDQVKFLAWLGIKTLEEIPQEKYKRALIQLERKVRKSGQPL